MSFQLSAQAITAQTAITRMSVRGCSTLRRRGSATARKCPTSRSMAMICSLLTRREDHLPPGNLSAIGFHASPLACMAGLPRGVVLMDAGYGTNTRLREEIGAL